MLYAVCQADSSDAPCLRCVTQGTQHALCFVIFIKYCLIFYAMCNSLVNRFNIFDLPQYSNFPHAPSQGLSIPTNAMPHNRMTSYLMRGNITYRNGYIETPSNNWTMTCFVFLTLDLSCRTRCFLFVFFAFYSYRLSHFQINTREKTL